MLLYLGLGFLASVFTSFGLVVLKSRAEALPAAVGRATLSAVWRWLRDPRWLGGLGIESIGFFLYVVALSGAPVSFLAVVMQGGIGLFVLFAALLLGERATTAEWVGIGTMVAAMLMLGVSLGKGGGPERPDIHALVIISMAALAVAMALGSNARLRRQGVAGAIASGLAFGLGTLYTKALTGAFLAAVGVPFYLRAVANPYLYATITVNLLGLVLLQNAFHVARGLIAMPLSAAFSNLVPIVGGIEVFGELLPHAPARAALRVGAFILTISGSVLLAFSGPKPQESARPPIF